MNNYNLLILDWDGTLIDSSTAVIQSIQHAAESQNFNAPTPEDIFASWGMTLKKIAHRLLPTINYEKFAANYHQHYSTCNSACLFDGVLETLKKLHAQNYTMAIATNKERYGLIALLEQLNLSHFFTAVRCGDDAYAKPSPMVISSILEELSIPKSKALMAGDSEFDMLTAQRANIDSVAVAYGLNTQPMLLEKLLQFHPKASINSFRDILQHI